MNANRFLPHLASRIFDTPLMIEASKAETILAVLNERVGLHVAAYEGDDDEAPQRKSYAVTDDGIAVIPVQGTLVKRASGLMALSGLSGYEAIGQQIQEAAADPAIRGILLNVDSPGGETHGCFELCDSIRALRAQKPIFAIANDCAASAAYAIASAAERIFVTQTGAVGSIGVFALHIDQSKFDKDAGAKYTFVFAGDKKVDGNPHEPLSDRARGDIQTEVSRQYDIFVSMVARNRGLTQGRIRDTQAGVFFGPGAVDEGLADHVGTFDDAMRSLVALCDHAEFEPAETAMEAMMPAIKVHHTDTTGVAWDGPANKRRLRNSEHAAYYEKAHAFYEAGENPEAKGSYTFIHHEVSGDGDIGAANLKACSSGIGILNGGRVGTTLSAEDRKGVHAHLAAHLSDAGEEPPELKGESITTEFLAESAGESAVQAAEMEPTMPVDKLALSAEDMPPAEEDPKKKAAKPGDEEPDGDEGPDYDGPPDGDNDEMSDKDKKKSKSKKAAKPVEPKEDDEACNTKKAASEDMLTVMSLCAHAGALLGKTPVQANAMAEKFVRSNLTVSQVRERLNEMQVASTEAHMIDTKVSGVAATPISALEAESVQYARANNMTKEQAFKKLVEENPDAYGDFRNKHNAKALRATLEAAGYEITQR